MKEIEVKFGIEKELSGTLEVPLLKKDKYPAILIIGGTGPGDRDGNMPMFKSNIYKYLAQAFQKKGIISLRYDKRKPTTSSEVVTLEQLLLDAHAAYIYLKSHPLVDSDKIYLLGHSEGTIISTLLLEEENPTGMILLSGAGSNLKVAMRDQLNMMIEEIEGLKGLKGKLMRILLSPNKILSKQDKLFEIVEKSENNYEKIGLQKIPVKWFKEHFEVSTEKLMDLIEGFENPVYFMTGTADAQARYENLFKIRKLNRENFTVELIHGVDHILRDTAYGRSFLNMKKSYKENIKKPLSSKFLESVNRWLDMEVLSTNREE